jgi:carbonic anhydrase
MLAQLTLRTLVVSVLTVTPALASEAHWTYSGHSGPSHWSKLEPDFETCGLGKHQSPIDIRGAKKADLPAIHFEYGRIQPEVVNSGHTIQVTVPGGSSIKVGDHEYDLQQFHFHHPSEEAISGARAAMVAHFVHKDADGKLAVVALLFDVGEENAALELIFRNLPARPNTETRLDAEIDPSAVLPVDQGYYEFEGSLTTPPCSEGVRWFVLQHHATISKAQLEAFTKLYPANARPLQPLNGREVRASR